MKIEITKWQTHSYLSWLESIRDQIEPERHAEIVQNDKLYCVKAEPPPTELGADGKKVYI